MILDLKPIVLPCGPCLRRFPLSPVARASSSAWAWAGRRRRTAPPLLDPLGPLARRGLTSTSPDSVHEIPDRHAHADAVLRSACRSRSGRRSCPSRSSRLVVAGALGLAHFVVDRTDPATVGVAARVHAGPAGVGRRLVRDASAASATGRWAPQSLRFFPARATGDPRAGLVPGSGRRSRARCCWPTRRLWPPPPCSSCLVRRETGDDAPARRALWVLSLLPAAFVLVMGYAESVLLVLRHRLLPGVASRPAGRSRPPSLRRWPPRSASPAALDPSGRRAPRPSPSLAELVRWWPRLGRRARLAGPRRGGGALRRACSRSWPGPRTPSATGGPPCGCRLQNTHHGGLSDPFTTLYHDAAGVLHRHVGTALHVPWVVLALALLVVCWRRLPAPYTLFAAGIVAAALAGCQPRFVRALHPQCLPAVDRRRARPHQCTPRAGGAHPAVSRSGRLRRSSPFLSISVP